MAEEIKKSRLQAAALDAFLSQSDKPADEQIAINPAEVGTQPSFEVEELEASIYDDLSEEEKEIITKQARAKVAEQLKEAKRKQFLNSEIARLKRKSKPGQEEVRCTVDLPGHSDRIVLDGTHYFHGVTYNFTRDQYNTVRDICARAWEHEHEIGGANRDVYRAPMNAIITPNAMTTGEGKPLPMIKF